MLDSGTITTDSPDSMVQCTDLTLMFIQKWWIPC